MKAQRLKYNIVVQPSQITKKGEIFSKISKIVKFSIEYKCQKIAMRSFLTIEKLEPIKGPNYFSSAFFFLLFSLFLQKELNV